ncbi:serine/threonine-protein kinase/endoribonuclease IRE1a-like, partial [Trifolium medium]|nr:serine/threonine-protein kinase/endoribonuclease IRE1a-like [Trifolium medium]
MGSKGTIVFEGMYDGRECAVKRLVKAHHDIVKKEFNLLNASDKHPNIIR